MKIAVNPTRLFDCAKAEGGPFWLYDAGVIREKVAALKAFDTVRYAQKANSNLHILRLMRELGVKVDAVSPGEIRRALTAGFSARNGSDGIVFTADLIDRPTLALVREEDIPVNAGSIDMLHQVGEAAPGHRVWLRINPGFGHGHSNKTNTGGEHSKHGIWHTDLPEALEAVKQHGLALQGLHLHIGSGVDYSHLQQVAGAMADLAATCFTLRGGVPLPAISAGGGLSIPYRDSDPQIDTAHYFNLWNEARQRIGARQNHLPHLELEPGRYLVAEAGLLVAEVRAVKQAGSNRFVLVEAGFNDLMRPAMYGSYHRISVLPRDGEMRAELPQVVAGPLCESGDVFTVGAGGVVEPRLLPEARVGDLLVFHDAGAYGASMSSLYNSRPLLPELLQDGNSLTRIRRRQSLDELLALEA